MLVLTSTPTRQSDPRTRVDDDAPLDSGLLLALDWQIGLSDLVVIRTKGIVQGILNSVAEARANLAIGAAMAYRSFDPDLGFGVGVEYSPPLARDTPTPPSLPTVRRYLLPDTHQAALQLSLGHGGFSGFDVRADSDVVLATPGEGRPYAMVQVGATAILRDLDGVGREGLRFGLDCLHTARQDQTTVALTIGRDWSSGGDIGLGLGVSSRCLSDDRCYSVHVTLDFAIPQLRR